MGRLDIPVTQHMTTIHLSECAYQEVSKRNDNNYILSLPATHHSSILLTTAREILGSNLGQDIRYPV
jgi:hypothetical protein